MSNLDDVMNAAREQASNLPAVNTQALAPAPTFSVGLDEFLTGGGIKPDKWLQLKDAGIRIDREDKAFVTDFTGTIDLSTVQLFQGARAEFPGNKVEYTKSYDGKTTVKGENFAQVLAQFKENSIKPADPYRGADILITLDAPVTQGKAVIPVGTKVGYSTPITGFAPFQSFIQKLVNEGRASGGPGGTIVGGTVKVKMTHEVRTSKANQDYGLLLIEEVA